MFTKKPAVKAAKTSLLWQQTDLNVIVCDSKAVKWSLLLKLQQSFWSSLNPNTIKQEIHVNIPFGWCVAEADWLIPGHSMRDDQWNCVLQISRELTQRWQQSCFSQLRWWFLETITVSIIFFKAFLVINNVSGDEWTYICEKQTSRISVCGH